MTISFIIPTAGRSQIEHCVASIVPQLQAGDEVLVIGDVTDGPLPLTQQIIASFESPQVRYLEAPKTEHSWGHREINYGIAQARGNWLSFNDDDDIWVSEAADMMRKGIAQLTSPQPILFRFLTYHGFIAWTQKGLFMQDHIGGHCIVTPNIPGKTGTWSDRYQGDWDFIASTVALYGGPDSIVWLDEIIAIARPPQYVIDAIMQNANRPSFK